MNIIEKIVGKENPKKMDAKNRVMQEISRIDKEISKFNVVDTGQLLEIMLFDENTPYKFKYHLCKPCWGNYAQLFRKPLFPRNEIFDDLFSENFKNYFNNKFDEFGIDIYINIVGNTFTIDFGEKEDFRLFKQIFLEHSQRGEKTTNNLKFQEISSQNQTELTTETPLIDNNLQSTQPNSTTRPVTVYPLNRGYFGGIQFNNLRRYPVRTSQKNTPVIKETPEIRNAIFSDGEITINSQNLARQLYSGNSFFNNTSIGWYKPKDKERKK